MAETRRGFWRRSWRRGTSPEPSRGVGHRMKTWWARRRWAVLSVFVIWALLAFLGLTEAGQ